MVNCTIPGLVETIESEFDDEKRGTSPSCQVPQSRLLLKHGKQAKLRDDRQAQSCIDHTSKGNMYEIQDKQYVCCGGQE